MYKDQTPQVIVELVLTYFLVPSLIDQEKDFGIYLFIICLTTTCLNF